MGTLVTPDGRGAPLALGQVGPGRYRGEFRVRDAGAYLVNIGYSGGTADAPQLESLKRAITIKHLLTHTSGIMGDFFQDAGRGEDRVAKFTAMMAALEQVRAEHEALGLALEDAVGLKLGQDALADEILGQRRRWVHAAGATKTAGRVDRGERTA